MNPEREYRSMEMQLVPKEEGDEPSFFVEGYASTFQPYTLFTRDGVDYKERIEPSMRPTLLTWSSVLTISAVYMQGPQPER